MEPEDASLDIAAHLTTKLKQSTDSTLKVGTVNNKINLLLRQNADTVNKKIHLLLRQCTER